MRGWKGGLVGGLLVAGATMGSATAQPTLVYTQPLTPQAIQAVQDRLRAAGGYAGRPDGIWGPDSQQALERFQQARGLQVTGQLNQATVATLGLTPGELLAADATTAPASATAPALSRVAVRNVQRRLRSAGYYRGTADGTWGAGTQQALERFQQARGLQVTGQMSAATATAMGMDPSNLER